MNAVVERLKKSRTECDDVSFDTGIVCGERWAKCHATYYELKLASTISADHNILFEEENPLERFLMVIWETIDLLQVEVDEFKLKYCDIDNSRAAERCMFTKGFVKGAQTVWEEVEDKLDD